MEKSALVQAEGDLGMAVLNRWRVIEQLRDAMAEEGEEAEEVVLEASTEL